MMEELEVYYLQRNWYQELIHKGKNFWKKFLKWLKLREEEKIRNKIALETYSEELKE